MNWIPYSETEEGKNVRRWAEEARQLQLGPCAKVTVMCVITTPDGETFTGTNACANPQAKCPREPGEGYAKCASICQQQGHAEAQALRLAGGKAVGATAELRGHTYACQACQEALYAAGVKWIGVRK